MSGEYKDSDTTKYATIENAQKCVDNAGRLYEDALKTSPPTQAALIELSIEELAKALLVLYKTPEFENSLLKVKFVHAAKIVSDLNETDFIKTLDAFKISDFKTRVHEKKLNFIQSIVKLSQQFYENEFPDLNPLIKIYGDNFSQYFPKSAKDPIKTTVEEISNLADSDISDLDEIKKDGFYVNFKDGKVNEPKNMPFQFRKLFRVFGFMRILIQTIIILLEGAKMLDYDPEIKDLVNDPRMKELVNELFDTPPSNSGNDAGGTNIVICSACKHKNPERAKFCMECGAKLE
jgi:hypothetical protein